MGAIKAVQFKMIASPPKKVSSRVRVRCVRKKPKFWIRHRKNRLPITR